MNRDEIETVVIGGGQAGLAVGYYLRQRQLPFVILDASQRVGEVWRNRWDTLRLFTPARFNALPGMPFPSPSSAYPGKLNRPATSVVGNVVYSVPGLYFIGLPFLSSLSSALLGGVGRDAGHIAGHIASARPEMRDGTGPETRTGGSRLATELAGTVKLK